MMKQVVALAAVVAAGVFIWRKVAADQAVRGTWQQVTDPLPDQVPE